MHALCGPRAWCLLWPSLAAIIHTYIHTGRPGIHVMMESRVATVEGKSRWLSPALPVPFDRALVAPRKLLPATSIFCVVGLKTVRPQPNPTQPNPSPLHQPTSRSARDPQGEKNGRRKNHATMCDISMFSKSRISPMVVHFLPHDATEGKMDVTSLPGAIPGCVSAPQEAKSF